MLLLEQDHSAVCTRPSELRAVGEKQTEYSHQDGIWGSEEEGEGRKVRGRMRVRVRIWILREDDYTHLVTDAINYSCIDME